MTRARSEFPRPGHDHGACSTAALERAEALCQANRARLTELRRKVLAAVWASHKPIGAYDLAATLSARGRRAAPMAIYRALDFLMEQGLVHRIASLNAFIGCPQPGRHDAEFLICRRCSTVAEIEDDGLKRALTRTGSASGFAVDGRIVEISGVCPNCRQKRRRR
jgi:Fur family zinc uptake transcriptional regulator